MLGGEGAIENLREAVRLSPDNGPLRRHLVETLIGAARFVEAIEEAREWVSKHPKDREALRALARACLGAGRASQAIVVIEQVCADDGEASDRVLLARALHAAGEEDRARFQAEQAVSLDPSLTDDEFVRELGITAPDAPGAWDEHHDDSSPVDPRAPQRPDGGATTHPEERPTVTFDEVGGMDQVKEQIRLKIIYPLEKPELYAAYGQTVGGGVLMYGPPGCGKTHLARATAGEVSARFISVGISDVLSMWIGESEHNLAALFEQARSQTPSVLFFDEADALGASRTDLRQSGSRNIINQFLNELDGMQGSNDGVLVLAATNAPWHIDPAFRRPGRFDRVIFVPPPDRGARAEIIKIQLRDKPSEGVDADAIAKKTEGFSGADLRHVVATAIEGKLREALKSGVPTPIRTKDLLTAAKGIRPTCKEWFASAKNHALYANQGGMYDEVLEYISRS